MSFKHHSMRNWHIWISVILGFPLILVGITTFFIAHEDALGTKHVMMPAWLGASEDMKKIDVKSVATMGEHTLIGTKYGIFTVNAGQAAPWRNSVQDDVRDLMVQGQGLYVAGKMGIWHYADPTLPAKQVYQGDCWQLNQHGTTLQAACKKSGLLSSVDGQTWTMQPLKFVNVQQAATPQPTLANVMMDIHTGKLFFGKTGEWIWIDLLGFAMVALGITGFVMWLRRRRQQAQ